ncbi:MAG TPA: DMT family transporter [Solirubrobacterales bacterium]|nr:DMT family transporter [Solirubrobacterales bacterium]
MSTRAWIVFAAVSVLWGFPYLLIKIAVDGGVPAPLVAWGRIALAAVVLLPIAWHRGTLSHLRGRGRWLLAFALVEIAIPFPLIPAGEELVASSTAAIVIATAPLMVTVLSIRFEPSERATGPRLAGLLIGLAGVIALVGVDVGGNAEELRGIAAVLVAALGYAIGPMILKRHLAGIDSVALMGFCLAVAGVLLTPLAAATAPAASPSGGAVAAIVVLGLLCTALALVLMAVLIREAGPARALLVTYVNPVIAVALGIVFLGESPGVGAFAGLVLILAGCWLATGGSLPTPRPQRTE